MRGVHRSHTIEIDEQRDLVVASCGGYPYDLNMIQAHKALDAASRACTPGGTIYLFAECPDGLGRDDFLDWFDRWDSEILRESSAKVIRSTARPPGISMRIAETYNVRIMTAIDEAISQENAP